jgi:hypothetical protein
LKEKTGGWANPVSAEAIPNNSSPDLLKKMPQHKTTSGLSLHCQFPPMYMKRDALPLLHSSTSGLRHGSVATHNIRKRVLNLKWQRPGEFGYRSCSSLPYPTPRGAASVYDLIEDENCLHEQVKVYYPLFGKALSKLFGILPEIVGPHQQNPV